MGLADAAMFEANIAEVYVNQGRLDEAERLLQSSLRLSRAAGWESHRAFEILHLGRIMAARGDDAHAISLLTQAADLLGGVGEPHHAAQALLHLALVCADAGRVDDAEDIVVAVSPHIGDAHRWQIGVMFDRVRVTVLAQRGDRDAAKDVLRVCGWQRGEPMGSSTTCGRCSISHAAWTCRTTSPQTAS